jgi:cyclophilin family peptidyl-prolyl cis-trans isomerase
MTTSSVRAPLASALLAASLTLALPAQAQEMSHDHMNMAAQPPPAEAHSGHQMDMPAGAPMDPNMPGMDHGTPDDGDMSGMDHGMVGALGGYGATREASGTAWQPDASAHDGVMVMRGDWMLMGHALLNGVYDRQNGRRGDDMGFVSGMIMGMAQRKLSSGDTIQFRAMLSPDPAMGKRGYALLLASGETADGVTGLVDRQHPHDLFMELAASYSHPLSATSSVFIYGGLPGEPAFGPPAFMHRASIMDSPEAPISHHWLDSTHITFGVVTAGVIVGDWKLEASRYHGREPDQHRTNIETGALDSTAARLSWNPTANWSLQGSWAETKSPEQLEPDANQRKLSASAIYTTRLAGGGLWSTTAAWGRRNSDHEDLDAWALESAIKPTEAWTVFARAERTDNNELVSVGGHHGPTYTVGKVSVGVIRDWRLADHLSVGLGGLYAVNFIPNGLEPLYGRDPTGAMAFVRLKID